MRLKVKVIPKSARTQIEVISAGELKVKVNSPPDRGKANRELIGLLAEHFGVSQSCIRIIRGEKSRNKVIEIVDAGP